MKVVIDGIEYVPRAELKPVAPTALRDAAVHLLTGLYLHGSVPSRGHQNATWDAIRALIPGVSEELGGEAVVILDRIHPEWRGE